MARFCKKGIIIFWIPIIVVLLFSTCAKLLDSISVSNFEVEGAMGKFLEKRENVDRPIVIVLPGSSKGFIKEQSVIGIIEKGYDVLLLAYHGIENLPNEMEKIPIEGVNNSIQWLRKNGVKEQRKIVVLGISKGAELGLVYASKYDDIDGLVCYSPSNFVLPNHVGVKKEESYKSSWTYKGEELSYARIEKFTDPAGKIEYKKYIEPILKDSTELMRGRIQVEDIKCPILLLSGKDDKVWPAYEMSLLIKRDVEKNNSNRVDVVGYENCGHQFFWFGKGEPQKVATSQSMRLTGIKRHRFIYGGEKASILKAMKASNEAFFDFMKKIGT